MAKKDKITVQGAEITIISKKNKDYISLTDMASPFKEGSGLIGKWITNKHTLEYLGIWEKINNLFFNYTEFGVIEQEAGRNRFIMSVGQWIERTQAIGMLVKAKISFQKPSQKPKSTIFTQAKPICRMLPSLE